MYRRAVEVEWLDSSGIDGWVAKDRTIKETKAEDLVCWSVGYVYQDTDDYLLIAQGESPENLHGYFQIPKVAIRQTWELRRK